MEGKRKGEGEGYFVQKIIGEMVIYITTFVKDNLDCLLEGNFKLSSNLDCHQKDLLNIIIWWEPFKLLVI